MTQKKTRFAHDVDLTLLGITIYVRKDYDFVKRGADVTELRHMMTAKGLNPVRAQEDGVWWRYLLVFECMPKVAENFLQEYDSAKLLHNLKITEFNRCGMAECATLAALRATRVIVDALKIPYSGYSLDENYSSVKIDLLTTQEGREEYGVRDYVPELHLRDTVPE